MVVGLLRKELTGELPASRHDWAMQVFIFLYRLNKNVCFQVSETWLMSVIIPAVSCIGKAGQARPASPKCSLIRKRPYP